MTFQNKLIQTTLIMLASVSIANAMELYHQLYDLVLDYKGAPMILEQIVTARTPEELEAALPIALDTLNKGESRYDAKQLIEKIKDLKSLGARRQAKDRHGHDAEYYVNDVLIISDPERKEILKALGVPASAIVTRHQYFARNLPEILATLEQLGERQKSVSFKNAANIVRRAQEVTDMKKKLNLLRIALEILDFKIAASFGTNVPLGVATVRTMLRDAATEYANLLYSQQQKGAFPQGISTPAHFNWIAK